MTSFVIEGGHPLQGEIRPVGNKNAALPMLAACLLTDDPVTLHNVPQIGDVQDDAPHPGRLGVTIAQTGSCDALRGQGERSHA